MIPAGVGDHAALALLYRERSDLVISPTQLESPDGLQVLQFEIELALNCLF
jgi:hypothetical protein